jgi:DNA-binding winged helix-turn-helix (wHTH) protein
VKFRFDEYCLDTEEKQVVGPAGPVSLRPQTCAVLCHLVEQAPSVVSRDELLDAVWGHQATSVSSVAQTIKELRQAFEDSSSDPRLIATRRRMGYQFIARVEREIAATDSDSPPPDDSIAHRGRLLRPWPSVIAAAAVFLLLTLWWAQPPPSNEPSGQVPTLAVAAVTNLDSDPALDWLEPALTRYLGHALVELAGFRVVSLDAPGNRADRSARPPDYLIDARFAALEPDGARLMADVHRRDADDIVFSVEARQPDWNVAELSIELAVAIRDTLGFSVPPDADSAAIRLRLPRVADAQKAYFAALDALGDIEPDRALEQIQLARRSEPNHPRLDHLQALALSLRGDIEAARAAAGRAMAGTALWPRRDRLDLEATAAALDFDFARAADRLQTLNQLFPDPSSIRRMIEAQIEAGRLEAANHALADQRMRLSYDPRLQLVAGRLAKARRDHAAQLESSQLAVRLAGQAGQPGLHHRGRLAEAEALAVLDNRPAAVEILERLIGKPGSLSEPDHAQALLQLSRLHLAEGRLERALATAQEASERFEAIPAPVGAAESALLLAAVHDRAGSTGLAVTAMADAVDRFHSIGDQRRTARANLAFGSVLARAGRNERALSRLDQAAAAFRSLGDRQGEANALFEYASTLIRAGRTIDAEAVLQRSLEAFIDADDPRGQARAIDKLAIIAAERGNLSGSIRLAGDALEILERLEAGPEIARVAFRQALTHRRLGDLAEAERRIRQSADAFATEDEASMQARALTVLGELLVSMDRLDELDPILETLEALATDHPPVQARVHALRGERALLEERPDQAWAEFAIAYDLIAETGSRQRQLTLRLDLARAALALGRSGEAEQRARELARAFEQAERFHRQIDALMLLAAALIDQGRGEEASTVLSRADQRLAASPDAERTLELALLRSRIPEGEQADQRLDWVAQKAAEQGFERIRQRALELRHRSSPGNH